MHGDTMALLPDYVRRGLTIVAAVLLVVGVALPAGAQRIDPVAAARQGSPQADQGSVAPWGAGAPFATPRGGTVWRYALIGAGIGAVAGGVFAFAFNHRAGLGDEDYGVITYIVLVPAGAFLGGGIGALVGATRR